MATSNSPAGKVKGGGFRAFLKKGLHHTHNPEPNKSEGGKGNAKGCLHTPSTQLELKTLKTSTPSVSLDSDGHNKGDPLTSFSHTDSGKDRLQKAKKQLEAAATNLNEMMSKVSEQRQVPEAIGLQNIKEGDNVEAIAKDIEDAIDHFIDARKIKLATASSRDVWKNCVKGWYKASFPFVKPYN